MDDRVERSRGDDKDEGEEGDSLRVTEQRKGIGDGGRRVVKGGGLSGRDVC